MILNNQEITKEIEEEIIHQNKWQWKPSDPELTGCSKTAPRSNFTSIQFHLEKIKEKSQMNNLTLHLNKNKQTSKLVEGKKSQKAEQK